MASLTFDDASGRFRDSAGRFVSDQAVRAVIDDIANGASSRMAAAAQAMLDGSLSLAEFQAGMMRTAKLAHLAAGTIATGGQARMTFSTYGQVGAILKSEYRFIRQFAEQISTGVQPLNGTIASRAMLYGQAARATYSKMYGEGQQRRGFVAERNTIRSGESCSGCRAESARGWVAVGSLVPTGSRQPCLRNCKCVIQYRREPAEMAA